MGQPDHASGHETRVQTLRDLLRLKDEAVVSRMLVKNTGGSVTLFGFDRGAGLSEYTAPHAIDPITPFKMLLVMIKGEQRD